MPSEYCCRKCGCSEYYTIPNGVNAGRRVCYPCRLEGKRVSYRRHAARTNPLRGDRRNLWYSMYRTARERATKKNLPFSLEKSSPIPVPDICPYLGIPLLAGYTGRGGPKDGSPTLDRIAPEKGYTYDNVEVISHRANRIKSDGKWEELIKIGERLRELNAR